MSDHPLGLLGVIKAIRGNLSIGARVATPTLSTPADIARSKSFAPWEKSMFDSLPYYGARCGGNISAAPSAKIRVGCATAGFLAPFVVGIGAATFGRCVHRRSAQAVSGTYTPQPNVEV